MPLLWVVRVLVVHMAAAAASWYRRSEVPAPSATPDVQGRLIEKRYKIQYVARTLCFPSFVSASDAGDRRTTASGYRLNAKAFELSDTLNQR